VAGATAQVVLEQLAFAPENLLLELPLDLGPRSSHQRARE